jgi:spore germination cell wall hydrolase CwlJ-like protein
MNDGIENNATKAAASPIGAIALAAEAGRSANRLVHLQQAARAQFDLADDLLKSIHDRIPDPAPVVPPEPASAPAGLPPARPTRSIAPVLGLGLAVATFAGTLETLRRFDVLAPGNAAIAASSPVEPTSELPQSLSIANTPVAATAPVEATDLGNSIYAHFSAAPKAERACLATAIYYEARGETYDGQVAVAQVILNRVRSRKWPASICGVVNQGVERGEKCQFSFVCHQAGLTPPHGDSWDQAQTLAHEVLAGRAWLRESVEATHYHATKVDPVWRAGLTPIGTFGSHIFYREPEGLTTGAKPYDPATLPVAAAKPERPKRAASAPAAAHKTTKDDPDWATRLFRP